MLPGSSLHRLAVSVFPLNTREQILEPQLADFQYEWTRATSRVSRLATLARGYGAFWCTLALCSPRALSRKKCDTLRRATEAFLMSAFVTVFIIRDIRDRTCPESPLSFEPSV